MDELENWNGRSIITPVPDLIITTDASNAGWGAVCNGVTTQGLCTSREKELHINVLELMAANFAVQAFVKEQKMQHIYLKMDNTVAVANINKMGGNEPDHRTC